MQKYGLKFNLENMKRSLQILSAILFMLPSAVAQSTSRPVFQNSTTGELVSSVATGAKTLTISATGTLHWTSGATLGGSASAFRTAAGLAIGSNIQAYDATLAALAALADSSGVLTNNGGGTLSYTATSSGGNGSADASKVIVFGANGRGNFTDVLKIYAGASTPGFVQLYDIGSVLSSTVGVNTLTANRGVYLPDANGTILTTGNLTDITATGTITSGTWNGTTIAVANGGTGSTTASAARVALLPSLTGNNGKVLAVNAGQTDVEWITAAGGGGLTIGTSTIASGTSGRVLYNNAGVVGEMTTSGSGTQLALTNSPTFTTPALGTPASGTLTNCTGLPAASVLGGTLGGAAYTLTGGTVTSSSPLLDMTQTWNAGGVAFVGISLSITSTASASASNFLNFALSGTNNRVQISKLGTITLTSAGSSNNTLTIANTDNHSITFASNALGNTLMFLGDTSGSGGPAQIRLGSTSNLVFWSTAGMLSGSADLTINREVAATLQTGDDTNGDAVDQTFKAADGITGTDRSGGDMTIASGRGTGAGSASAVIFSTPTALSTGTTAQTLTERARITSAGITIGSGGSAISKVLTATATLDFGSLAAQTSADLTITVTGAAVGDAVIMGLPAAPDSGVVFNAFVSSSNTITVRATNATSGAIDPASATFRATVIQH